MGLAATSIPSFLVLALAMAACGTAGGPQGDGAPSTAATGSAETSSLSPATPTGPSAASSPADGPSPLQSPASGWVRATVPAGLGAPLTRVAWTGTRFLAVDRVEQTVLDSTDGRIWQRQQRGPDGSISEVAARPGQVLAAGSRNVQDAYGTIALWLSRDGLNWSAVPDAASLHSRHGEFLTMAAILPTDEGWLAVGGESLMCVPAACRLVRAVAWTSPDGLEWTRSADSAAMEHAQMTGVVRTQTGFLAVGAAAADPSRPGSAIRPAVWTSADGRSWTRSDGLPVVKAAQDADVTLDSVARVGRHVVAVGHVTAPSVAGADAFAWWSEGADWSSVAVGRNATSGDVRVAAIPDGMLAMFAFGSDSSCRSPIWMSADGASWDCIGNDPVFAGSAVWDAAWAPEVEVLVGSGADGAVVWTSALH